MRCHSCGAVIYDNAAFCTVCGARQDPVLNKTEQKYDGGAGKFGDAEQLGTVYQPDQGVSSVGSAYAAVFREPLFLAITILMTVAAAVSLFTGISIGGRTELNMAAAIPILYAVALWLIFAEFRSDKQQYSTTGLAIASGTTKAVVIITWIAVGIVAVVMVLLILFGHLLVNYITFPFIEDFPDIMDIPGAFGASYVPLQSMPRQTVPGLDTAMILVIVICGVVAIAILVILNIFFYKKLHRFTKSLCVGLKNDYLQVDCVKPVKAWLIVMAVITFIGALSAIKLGPLSAVGSICQGLAAIFASVLIGRHFSGQTY